MGLLFIGSFVAVLMRNHTVPKLPALRIPVFFIQSTNKQADGYRKYISLYLRGKQRNSIDVCTYLFF